MPRFIPPALLAHKAQDATTLCKLLKISMKDGTVLGTTTLDRDVTYDDGDGPITYRAPIGFQSASIYQALGFEVSTTEAHMLMVPEYDFELDEFKVNSGVYDYADFDMIEINYEDHSMGHWVVMHGTTGQMRSQDGLQIFGELRSISDGFRRKIVQNDSLSCRARFGSQPGEERFPCGYDASSLWINSTVTSVGLENTQEFSASSLSSYGVSHFVPGLIQFLTGNNQGRYIEVDTFDVAGKIFLRHPLAYVIQNGDTFRIRRDCNKRARDTAKGCEHWFGTSWGLRFRGEPDIPVGDIGTLTTPGSGVGPGNGGSVSTGYTEEGDGGDGD